MSEEEHRDIRIAAARILCPLQEDVEWLLEWGGRKHRSFCLKQEDAYNDLLPYLPNPLLYDAVCNMLLVATMMRGWYLDPLSQISNVRMRHMTRDIPPVNVDAVPQDNSLEAHCACWREVVTRACIAAKESETR